MSAVSYSYFLQSLGWALLNSLWQMALLWVIYHIIISAVTKLKSDRKTALATIFIIAGFIWFLFTFISSLFFETTNNFYSGWINLINEKGWSELIQIFLVSCSLFYLFVLVIPVWKFILNYRHVQVIRKNGLKKISAEWKIFVVKTSANMGIVRKVQIWLSDIVKTPVTIGSLRPVILLPVAAINNLSVNQVEAIILHELNHIRRYDYLFNLLINFIKTILYFNPFVKLFVKSIEREREISCDEMVIQFQYQPEEYASALLLLQKNQQQIMMIAAAGKNHDLLDRVESILGIGKKTNFSLRQIAIPFITVAVIGLFNIFFTVNSKKVTGSYFTLSNNISPYYFVQSDQQNNPGNNLASYKETQRSNSANHSAASTISKSEENSLADNPAEPFYKFAANTSSVIPALPDEEEKKLQATIDATKRILEEKQWHEIEKNYAEVYNSVEKELLKNEYQKEVDKVDWNKLETQLRLSYEKINWDKVNEQVNLSLTQIKLDSIQNQVKIAINDLVYLENWLKENNTTSIPDTDISLDQIREKRQKMKLQLDKIRVIKSKKIIRL